MRYECQQWTEHVEATDLLKGLAAGLIGGLAASWVMTQFQNALTGLSQKKETADRQRRPARELVHAQGGERQPVEQESPPQREQDEHGQRLSQQEEGEQEAATVKAAEAISERLFHHALNRHEKQIAGPAVHYTYGTLVGGLYGVLAEPMPQVTAGAGTLYGTALWLGGDEVAVPLLGLSKPITQTPLSTHAYALASHLVYGLTLEGVRRIVRAGMGD